MNILKLFFSFDTFNYLTSEYNQSSSLIYPFVGLLAFIVQTGVFIGPIIGMIIPNNWRLVYRILLGSIVGMFLSAIKDLFTDKEHKRAIAEIKATLQTHDERLSNHDERLSNHDERLSNHDERLSNHDELHKSHIDKISLLEEDREYSRPYVPCDLPSP